MDHSRKQYSKNRYPFRITNSLKQTILKQHKSVINILFNKEWLLKNVMTSHWPAWCHSKILSNHWNYITGAVMRPKSGNYSVSIGEVFKTLF